MKKAIIANSATHYIVAKYKNKALVLIQHEWFYWMDPITNDVVDGEVFETPSQAITSQIETGWELYIFNKTTEKKEYFEFISTMV